MTDLESQLAQGEEAFGRGDLRGAREILTQCADDSQASATQRVQALNDLAVIAFTEQRLEDAQCFLLRVLAEEPTYLPALENIGECCAKQGDLVQASHWFARALELSPDEEAGRFRLRLESIVKERRRDFDWTATGGSVATPDDALGSGRSPGGDRVLIVVDWFYPAVGGTERLAEAIGVALQAQGLIVEIAARHLPERTSCDHRGMAIRELAGDYSNELAALVTDGAYDSVLAIGGTLCWPVLATLQLPFPRPRIVVVPCVNAGNYTELHANPDILPALKQLIGAADVIGYSSHTGYDVRLWEELGLPGVYVPNAVERVNAGLPSPTRGIRGDGVLLLLHVANFWPEKDHIGLLRALREDPGEWQLALIGAPSPDQPQIAEEVARLAREDPRVHLLGPTTPELVAAAMDDADLFLLPSLAEATPLVLLEAMSRALPWIATPTCGAAHDHAGGLILPLALFGEGIEFLGSHPQAAAGLGCAGQAHWRDCYNWDIVGPRYARILRGQELSELNAPPGALADTDAIRDDFYDWRPRRASAPSLAGARAR